MVAIVAGLPQHRRASERKQTNIYAPLPLRDIIRAVPEKAWWTEPGAVDHWFNGVFKGGGARGIVYAGALAAVLERKCWFKAVAGSSAGAITAALVAAGLEPEQMREATADALDGVRGGFGKSVVLMGGPPYRTYGLSTWLEETLAKQIEIYTGQRSAGRVTFAELFVATGIELNVVVMDLARKQPFVLNHYLAPDCQVTDAVLASSAIPVAFRPGRLDVLFDDRPHEIHRLVDGGAWANYPAFVFKDASFRSYYELPPPDPEATTVGFAMGGLPGPRPYPDRLVHSRGQGLDKGRITDTRWGRLLNNWPIRAALPSSLLVAAYFAIPAVVHELRVGLPHFPLLARQPAASWAVWLVLALCIPFMGGFLFLAALILRYGDELFDVGLPSLRAALAVGTGVPDWVGHEKGDHLVRLSDPADVKATTFRIKPIPREQAIAHAHVEALPQLDSILERIREASSGTPPIEAQPALPRRRPTAPTHAELYPEESPKEVQESTRGQAAGLAFMALLFGCASVEIALKPRVSNLVGALVVGGVASFLAAGSVSYWKEWQASKRLGNLSPIRRANLVRRSIFLVFCLAVAVYAWVHGIHRLAEGSSVSDAMPGPVGATFLLAWAGWHVFQARSDRAWANRGSVSTK
jgi:predicted acylesterase/phospholipase RssA